MVMPSLGLAHGVTHLPPIISCPLGQVTCGGQIEPVGLSSDTCDGTAGLPSGHMQTSAKPPDVPAALVPLGHSQTYIT